jgi:starch phosphorylase
MMAKKTPDKSGDHSTTEAHVEMLQAAPLEMTADALFADLNHYFSRNLGRRTVRRRSPFLYEALVYATRDRLMERWNQTNIRVESGHGRRAYYLSMEYLMGRLLRNALLSLDLNTEAADALDRIGVDLESLVETEHDTGLGNGGLGRLAACFLDSCATLGLPVMGYGLRYHYGMFRQRIDHGYQVEKPDAWLRDGFPWEIQRPDLARVIRFGGQTTHRKLGDGRVRHGLADTHDVLAVPYDIPIPGYRNNVVNTLRLWSAAATDEFDLDEFNAGGYAESVAAKNEAENITMVLYPNDATESGRELRLRQQYFLASASLQDVLANWDENHEGDFSGFAEGNVFQLNDTHPAISVPELMRLLMDEYGLDWDDAWAVTTGCMAYTNHTLLPEALEVWPESLIGHLLPRIMEIIHEINRRYLEQVAERWPGAWDRLDRMSLIQQGHEPMVRMAYLAIVGSYSVNGVAELHSRLLREGLLKDFAELWPEKFNNKTNGVTQRRWLKACNPGLSGLIDERIGEGWVTDLDQLSRLRDSAEDPEFRERWRAIKLDNKRKLAALIERQTGLECDPTMLFDVQVKRIHEYKRQLLNLLHVIHLYDRVHRGDTAGMQPRMVLIGGKAAPGYVMAKDIIKCINNVAERINRDRKAKGLLQLVFLPDYNVSAMEVICPAAELSEQISTAGKEASGTGNMKFMMNGALTIGTLDGANVEIREAVGEDNFFLFGLTVEEVRALRPHYDPQAFIDQDEDFSRVMQLLESGHFNPAEPGVMDTVIRAIRNPRDPWMTAADFRSFVDAQARAAAAYADSDDWTRMSILNSAASGRFSTDRTMADYNRDIWRLDSVDA